MQGSFLFSVGLIDAEGGNVLCGKIFQRVNEKTADSHFKVEMRFFGNLDHSGIADGSDLLACFDLCALGNAGGKILCEVFVDRNCITVMTYCNAVAHEGIAPDLLYRAFCGGVNGSTLGGGDINTEVDPVIVHRVGEDLSVCVVLLIDLTGGRKNERGKGL